MKIVARLSHTEDQKNLRFRDMHAKISRILIIISMGILAVAMIMLTVALRRGLDRRVEMVRLIGLAEAQGGDIVVAKQIYEAMQRVGKLTKLPDNEVPVFATVADIAKLQEQPLFKDVVNGDQILFYAKSQWVYVYRPQIDKIVVQGPFAIQTPTPQLTRKPKPKVQEVTPMKDIPDASPSSPADSSIASPEANLMDP